jgi:hypothetical protein
LYIDFLILRRRSCAVSKDEAAQKELNSILRDGRFAASSG